MKKIHLFIVGLSVIGLFGCDAVQKAKGIVLDKNTRLPLDSVAYGEGEKENGSSSHRRSYTGKDGVFDFSAIGGSNSFELYFSKPGYKTTSKEMNNSRNDTIYLEKQ